MIFAVPAVTPVTLPVLSTVATASASLDHKAVSVVSAGVTVAVNCSVLPESKVKVAGRVTAVAGVNSAETVTLTLSVLPSTVTVMVTGSVVAS